MKLSLATVFLTISLASANRKYRPERISFASILNDGTFTSSGASDAFTRALSNVGMVAIKNVPSYDDHRSQALSQIHRCAVESAASRSHTFPDGTVRRTMATHTVPGPGGTQKLSHGESASSSCEDFTMASDPLREIIAHVTQAFANRLGETFDTEDNRALLSTQDGAYDFDTFGEVVENGEHLEHFHSYQRTNPGRVGETIEMHTDQGLFIAFTPGMLTGTTKNDVSSTGGFYIEQKDGSQAEVDFNPSDIIIMLGDGVDQFVNHRLKDGVPHLRATPHTLTVSNHGKDQSRVWYGRMVLPPSGAVHPKHGKTFGELRRLMIEASLSGDDKDKHSNDHLSLGCSSDSAVARQLEETTCEDGTTFCWHRCMAHSDYGINNEVCAERQLGLQCINPREQVYTEGHGDFFPACTNSTELVTDYPKLLDYPRDIEVCNEMAWETFSATDGYDHVFDRLGDNRGNRGFWDTNGTKGQGKVARFMWNVVGDKIDGKLVFNGLFGYLALGFAHPTGRHNGMNGASIIMGVPGGNYSAKFGLDLSIGDNVQEYVIDLNGSSFRHWSDPLPNRDTSIYDVITGDCFTALTFESDNINDIKFNVSGTDDLIWGANNGDHFCGYHGRGEEGMADRDRFMIEWKTGKGWFAPEMEIKDIPDVEIKDIPGSSSAFLRLGSGSLVSAALFIIATVNYFI